MPVGGRLLPIVASALGLAMTWMPLARAATDSVFLEWTAPGDDGNRGEAAMYDVRFSRRPINESNFFSATRAHAFRPRTAGARERVRVTGLEPGLDYYFAVKTVDESGNWSSISNVAVRPSRIVATEMPEPAFSMPWPNPARTATRFALSVQGGEPVRVEAFDAAGRRVRTLIAGFRAAEPTELVWDLTDDDGRPVRAGTYLVRARLREVEQMRRVLVIR